jgi:choline dehydrogenase-like flavoprotein
LWGPVQQAVYWRTAYVQILLLKYCTLLQGTTYNWAFDTAPEPHLENRRLFWPRGKGLGGSSSINAPTIMVAEKAANTLMADYQ